MLRHFRPKPDSKAPERNSRDWLSERVKCRADSIQNLRFESSWPDVCDCDRDQLNQSIAVLQRLQERDQKRLDQLRDEATGDD